MSEHRESLVELVRSLSQPLAPLVTGVEPRLKELTGIRAVVFDVYGTLLVSGVGDISLAQAEDRNAIFLRALRAVGYEVGQTVQGVDERFYDFVKQHQAARRAEGIKYPEIEIRAVMHELLEALLEDGVITGDAPDEEQVESFCITYECFANPTCPMPDMADTLDNLCRSGYKLGIVSNAQFFTPLLFEAQAGRSVEAFGFNPELCVWSYEMLEGKPSTALYEALFERISEEILECDSSSILFIGNDMRNDVMPAHKVGMRTALFAGDKRSLRMREDDEDCRSVEPDLVLTSLSQLPECLA